MALKHLCSDLYREKQFKPNIFTCSPKALFTNPIIYDPVCIEREALLGESDYNGWPPKNIEQIYQTDELLVKDLETAQQKNFYLENAYLDDDEYTLRTLWEKVNRSLLEEFPYETTTASLILGLAPLGRAIGINLDFGEDLLYEEFLQNAFTLARLYMIVLRQKYEFIRFNDLDLVASIREDEVEDDNNGFGCLTVDKSFLDYVKDRLQQDRFRFATSADSPMRIKNYYNRLIAAVNRAYGICPNGREDNPYYPNSLSFENIERVLNS